MLKFRKGNKERTAPDCEKDLIQSWGWTLVDDEVRAELRPVKKTVKPEPAVEQEVGTESKGD
jgi:hypothetical protein